MISNKLLHGGDYNPEQWLEYPEVLEEDIRLMKEANVNCVTLGVFSWAMLEVQEGVFDFAWLEKIIERLYSVGISVILATPTGALPHWLTQKYPEVMQVQDNGQRNLPGRRHNFCYTSPVMREKARIIDEELGRRFGKNPAVIMWHISNELGGNFGDGTCHCELCQEAFRQWLKEKYKTLDNLNRSWWNRFWSHTYTDWSQIHSPVPNGEPISHSLNLDWKRFVTARMTDFCSQEIAALRQYSDLPVTTNFMDFFKNLDYQKLHKCLDVVSWDSYPHWHIDKDEVPVAVKTAAGHSVMRSLKKKPFILMESTPTCVNWRNINPVKRPGMHMLSSMQAIAHGSDSVQYFQWRKGRGAFEKFHGAVLDHKNGGNTRAFREVSKVGERLENITEIISGTVNSPKAAIVFDWENWWALEDMTGPRLDIDYVDTVLKHYRAFWESGIDVDFISMEDDLSSYKMVCAPINYLYKDDYAEKVEQFVAGGGCYVTTYFSGMVNDTDLCFIEKHPLEDVMGIIQEEIDAPGDNFENSICYKGKSYRLGELREVIHAKEGVQVLTAYEEDYCKGSPVVTCNSYKEGTCYYIAAVTEREFLTDFYRELLSRAGIQNPLEAELPYGVTTAVRQGADSEVVFVMNFRNEAVRIKGISSWKNSETGEIYEDSVELGAWECKIITKYRD